MVKRICDIIHASCPCRIRDLDKDIFYCNFIELFVQINIKSEPKKRDRLLRSVCTVVRDEIFHHNYKASQLQKQEKEFLKRVRPGDVVFCTAETDDVIFVDHPSNKYGDCKYKNVDGEIWEAPSFCFRIISRGNKFTKFQTKDKKKLDEYSRLARRNGFKVETKDLKGLYLLKIFGDTQEEVDDFISCLKNDLVFFDF